MQTAPWEMIDRYGFPLVRIAARLQGRMPRSARRISARIASSLKTIPFSAEERAGRLTGLSAGYRSKMRFITQLPKVNLWGELEAISIDFLETDAVRDILIKPLAGTQMVVMSETVKRVFDYTQGYPEIVQRMGASMLAQAQRDKRLALTPSDADAAAHEISETEGIFAETWCPLGELTSSQRTLIGSFINTMKNVGDHIEPHRLFGAGGYTDQARKDVDDLVARKILVRYDNATTVGIKAPILEMWMRNHWKNEEPPLTAAIFMDLANLTQKTGNDILIFTGMDEGDVGPGTFKLKTVLDVIDNYAADLVPTPVTEKYAINYPPGSRAVPALNMNGYHVANLPQELIEKAKREPGVDDTFLITKIAELTSDRPALTHIVLVTGDKDYRLAGVDLQLARGKSVHILARRGSTANELIRMAQQYPQKCKLRYIEDLMAEHMNSH